MSTHPSDSVRIDKWLWAARFFKTRSLATAAVDSGRIILGEVKVKPSRNVRVGDRLIIQHSEQRWEVDILGLSEQRGPASVAVTLYQETTESIAARQQAQSQRRYQQEPASERHGRPTKRDRRDLARVRWD